MAWVTKCFECWGNIPMDPSEEPIGSLNCTTCPHCGHHRRGALQQQAGRPCPSTDAECAPCPCDATRCKRNREALATT